MKKTFEEEENGRKQTALLREELHRTMMAYYTDFPPDTAAEVALVLIAHELSRGGINTYEQNTGE